MSAPQRIETSVNSINGYAQALAAIDYSDLSRSDTDKVKQLLTGIQIALQASFPALKAVRKEVYSLQPGEAPSQES